MKELKNSKQQQTTKRQLDGHGVQAEPNRARHKREAAEEEARRLQKKKLQ